MVLQSRRQMQRAARIDDADEVSSLRTGGGAFFLRRPAITALHVAPEIHGLTLDGDGRAFRLRDAHNSSKNHNNGESGDDGRDPCGVFSHGAMLVNGPPSQPDIFLTFLSDVRSNAGR